MRVVTRLQITVAILDSTFTPMGVTRPRDWVNPKPYFMKGFVDSGLVHVHVALLGEGHRVWVCMHLTKNQGYGACDGRWWQYQ